MPLTTTARAVFIQIINAFFSILSLKQGIQLQFLNTFFFTKLTRDGVEAARRFTRHNKLSDCQLALVPIQVQERKHWILAVVKFEDCEIHIFDSLMLERESYASIHDVCSHCLSLSLQSLLLIPFFINVFDCHFSEHQQIPCRRETAQREPALLVGLPLRCTTTAKRI